MSIDSLREFVAQFAITSKDPHVIACREAIVEFDVAAAELRKTNAKVNAALAERGEFVMRLDDPDDCLCGKKLPHVEACAFSRDPEET